MFQKKINRILLITFKIEFIYVLKKESYFKMKTVITCKSRKKYDGN